MIIVVTIYNDCLFFGQALLYCFNLYCLIALCLFHMHFKVSAYNDRIMLLFSENTCPMVQELHRF